MITWSLDVVGVRVYGCCLFEHILMYTCTLTCVCIYIYIMYIYYNIYIMYMKINPTYMAYMKSVNFGGHMHIHKLYTVILGPMMFGVCVCGCAA